jgi:hypothetical protein
MGTGLLLEGEAMTGAILGCCRGTALYILVAPCAAGGGAQY